MITLYDMELSGNAYKIRLLLSLLGVDYEKKPISLADGENRTQAFLALNPRGQVPVLADGDTVIWDSQAVLVYLARRYGDETWLPIEPVAMASVMQWMAVAENEALFGLARARAVKVFGRPWNFDECYEYGLAGLKLIDAHLTGREWLATDHATIADVACYPYVAVSREGGLPLDEFKNVQAWMTRVQSLPGYVSMPGIKLD